MGTVIYDKKGGYTGFLGNVMFQAAATIGIAKKHGMDYVFPYKDFYDVFQLQVPQRSVEELSKMPTVDYAERGFHYSEVNLNPDLNYNLTGYFQSKKYWAHCEDLIRETFKFKSADFFKKDVPDGANSKTYPKSTNAVPVSIHIRRGDYCNLPNHHPVLTMDYYNAAIDKMYSLLPGKNLFFNIHTNDTEWCSSEFSSLILDCKADIITGFSAEDAMCHLSMNHHHIIANSSFSWWGSYLGTHPDKIIIAPPKDKWFGSAYKDWSVDDLYCENFTIL